MRLTGLTVLPILMHYDENIAELYSASTGLILVLILILIQAECLLLDLVRDQLVKLRVKTKLSCLGRDPAIAKHMSE